jgi:hypothetical protein
MADGFKETLVIDTLIHVNAGIVVTSGYEDTRVSRS